MTSTVQPTLDVSEYLGTLDGRVRPDGLIFGFPRRAPIAVWPDGAVVLERLAVAFARCFTHAGSGDVLRSPVDLVLSQKDALVLHPPIVVLLPNRFGTLRKWSQVYGAPNIVVELLWPATARRTRCSKVRWYRAYGVEECWLIDARTKKVEVLDFRGGNSSVPRIYGGDECIASRLLRACRVSANELFANTDRRRDHRRRRHVPPAEPDAGFWRPAR